jgi:two-component system nitrate/nitrite response regulator NarL
VATERISVFVADDHPVFREAIGRAVKARPDFALVGLAADGREALDGIRDAVPAISLVDQHLPSLLGTDILRPVQREAVPTRVIVLSASDSAPLVYDALRLGATGFLTKMATMAEIWDAIVAVARGRIVVAPEAQSALVGEMRARSQPERPVLSQREAQVLALIAEGLSVPRISDRLIVGASTVKTHVRNLFEKLGVRDRAAAVAEGMRRGLPE